MIKLTDAGLLAFTKLRTRKIRTSLTILLASLLFGILVAASLIMTGAFTSVDNFRKDGLTSRYIVTVHEPISPSILSRTLRDPTMIAEAKVRYEQIIEAKKAEAKRLGLSYNQASDQPPYSLRSDGVEALSPTDPNNIVHGLLTEKYADEPAFDDKKLQSIANRYNSIGIFASENFSTARGSTLVTHKDAKEVFYDQSDETETELNYIPPLFHGLQITIAPPEITDSFILSNNAGWKPDSDSLPIILPQNTLEQLLGLEKLPDKASSIEKLDRLKSVRTRASSLTFQACYRDNASSSFIQETLRQQKEINTHKNDKDYLKPSVIYALPDPAKCENPTVTSDTRTAEEKKQTENQELFDQKFGKDTEPTSYFVKFKVVGVSPAEASSGNPGPDQPTGQIRNLDDIVTNLLKTNGIGQTVPQTLFEQLPDKEKYADILAFNPMYLFGNEDNKTRYVEFANAQDAEKFIDEQSCTTQYDNTCKPIGRPYQASLVFSNSAALDDIKSKTSQWFEYAIFIVIVLAAVIMWITIGRTIADGRRETAVFRAIGFKRIDIAIVYVIYTAILSVFVAMLAICIGSIGAFIVNDKLAPILTAQAQYNFGGLDLTKEVTLISMNQQQLALLLIACLATGIVSVVTPLLRNVRRNPIRDMREE